MNDIQYDVIVIGSGIAGSSAGLEAARAGAKVLLLEKERAFGGSAALSAGMYWTAPSLDAYLDRIPDGNEALGKLLVESFEYGLDRIRSLQVHVSETITENIMTYGIGRLFDVRSFLDSAREYILSAGGRCLTDVKAHEILQPQKDLKELVCIRGESKVKYKTPTIIVASGGFQGDRELLGNHMPQADKLVFRSNPGSTGDGLRMIQQLGVEPTGSMGSFYGHLVPYPLNKFDVEKFLPYSQYYSEATIMVNLDGKRFVDETLGDEISNQFVLEQPNANAVMIFDSSVYEGHAVSEPFPGVGLTDRVQEAINAGGYVSQAETLHELCEEVSKWGVPQKTLLQTIEQYNRAVVSGAPDANGIAVSRTASVPVQPPFYAVAVQPSITFTFGGIPIDVHGQILKDGVPIRGLYAAGADVGGVSSVGYAGGLAPAFITGMTAGWNASNTAFQLNNDLN